MTVFRPGVVGVIGLGYVGQPFVAALANVGYRLVGMDIDSSLVRALRDAGRPTIHEPGVPETYARCRDRISFTDSYEKLMESVDAVCITVGTPLDAAGRPELSSLEAVAAGIGPLLRPGHLVVLRSTVTPGTTSRVARELEELSGLTLGKDLYVAFCPERTIEGMALNEMYNLPNIVSGVDPESLERCAVLMSKFGTRVIRVSTPEIAEICKLADNSYRSVNIAFANELGLICESLRVDGYEVVNAVNTAYARTQIFKPGLGADGPCLSKDPAILANFAEEAGVTTPLLAACLQANDAATARVAREIRAFAEGKDPSSLTVAMLGLAFKGYPETDDVRGSPAKRVCADLAAEFRRPGTPLAGFRFFDPVVRSFNGDKTEKNIDDCVRGANVVLFLTNHPALRGVSTTGLLELTARPLLVVDAWHNVDADHGAMPQDVTFVRIGDGS